MNVEIDVMELIEALNRYIDDNGDLEGSRSFVKDLLSLLRTSPVDHPIWIDPVRLLITRIHILEKMNA